MWLVACLTNPFYLTNAPIPLLLCVVNCWWLPLAPTFCFSLRIVIMWMEIYNSGNHGLHSPGKPVPDSCTKAFLSTHRQGQHVAKFMFRVLHGLGHPTPFLEFFRGAAHQEITYKQIPVSASVSGKADLSCNPCIPLYLSTYMVIHYSLRLYSGSKDCIKDFT